MRKRQKPHHTRATPRQHRKKHTSRTAANTLRNQILAALYLSETNLNTNDILKALALPRSLKDDIEQILSWLCHEGTCFRSANKCFALGKKHNLIEATVEMSQSGYGFAIDTARRFGGKTVAKDPYISARMLHSAIHGDRVLAAINKTHRDGRSEAEVLRILKRRTTTIAGFYSSGKKHGIVSPEDIKYPANIIVSKPPREKVEDGDAVIIRLEEENDAPVPLQGRIVEVLGNPQLYDVQVRLVIEKFGLPHQFSRKAEDQARTGEPRPPAGQREDLRSVEHVTIDGEDAKDFDDAIAVIKRKQGYRLYVSIADVSAFVQTGSSLDEEAYERGTSVYLPGTVIPMLPEHLSNNLCSLLPETDRLAVSAILDIDQRGSITGTRFVRSVIRSRHRFTYDKVKQIIIDKDQVVRQAHMPLASSLDQAGELARLLQKKRESRGSISFTLPESKIIFGQDNQVISIKKVERNFSHQMIEEFMLAANEAVAKALAGQQRDLLYRIHEEPSPEKIADFVTFGATLGLVLPKNPGTPEWYNKLISMVKGTSHEYIVNSLLLRSMQQARYSPVNCGHFGLATDLYTHFTSPIRRYPDLIVHRLLCELIQSRSGMNTRPVKVKIAPASTLKECGLRLSERERRAIASERNMTERLQRSFMAQKIGETFRGVISGVSSNALFVELLDCFISGTVLLSALTDDYYILDEKNHRLIGDVSCRVLQVGNLIDVVLVDVDSYQNKMFFTLDRNA